MVPASIFAIRIADNRFFSDTACLKTSCRRGRLEATEGTNVGHAVDGGSRSSEIRGEGLSRSVME